MKTRAFKYLKLMLLALAMVNLTSCEVEIGGFWDHDDYSPGYYEKSSVLCSRTWADDYIDADGKSSGTGLLHGPDRGRLPCQGISRRWRL